MMGKAKWNGRYDAGMAEGGHYERLVTRPEGMAVRRMTLLGRESFCETIIKQGPAKSVAKGVKKFIKDNHIPLSALPGSYSWEGIFNYVLAAHPEYVFSREDLVMIKRAFQEWFLANPTVTPRPRGLQGDGDVIQHVNKSGQWGLAHQKVVLEGRSGDYYLLREPYSYKPAARKLQELEAASEGDRDSQIARIKEYHLQEWISVPNGSWDAGHRSPGDGGAKVWQPKSYQRSRRDRFKFDELGMVLCPSVEELLAHPDKYYSKDERAKIARALTQQ